MHMLQNISFSVLKYQIIKVLNDNTTNLYP